MTAKRETSFQLRVEFSGLCLFVRDRQTNTMTVVMPDARQFEKPLKHEDGSDAVPHVGYLRFDLANLASGAAGVETTAIDSPAYEVVHRFDREQLTFDIAAGDAGVRGEPALPDFDTFAPVLEVRPGVLATPPEDIVLMRTELRCGTLVPDLEQRHWTMPSTLHPQGNGAGALAQQQFGGMTTWTCTVPGDTLTLRLTRFDDPNVVTTIPLRPTPVEGKEGELLLKVANLCADNPLEWEELPDHRVEGEDADFRWTYKLLQLKAGANGVAYPPATLPAPDPVLRQDEIDADLQSSEQDCFGGKISV